MKSSTNDDELNASPSPSTAALSNSPANSTTSSQQAKEDPIPLFAQDESLHSKDGDAPEGAQQQPKTMTWSRRWTNLVRTTHAPILYVLQTLSSWAVRFPRWTVSGIALFSLGLLAFAVYRGVPVETNDQFSPRNSPAIRQSSYLYGGRSGFRGRYRYFSILLHAGVDEETGAYRDILNSDFIDKSFQVISAIQNTEGYNKTCTQQKVVYSSPFDGRQDCEIYAVTRYWNHNITAFRQEENVTATISKSFFPDGQPAAKSAIYGRYNETNLKILTSLESTNIIFYLPAGSMAYDFEKYALDTVLGLRKKWKNDFIQVEVQAESSLSKEFARTITDDIPLVAIIFIVMSVFTAIALSRWHSVQSRGLLGVGAVVTVLLSIATGFGIMFLTGVPFSNLTQILPFIIFGIGLDDAFIVIGAYERTNPKQSTRERVRETINDIGLSITLTSLTSAVAFGLGCLSSVYSVYWLCLYAMPVIIIVFLYTMTFFVALVALDDHRISQNRRDCCVCFRGRGSSDDTSEPTEHIADRFMGWYASILLKPVSKAIILIGFFVLLVNCAISASKFSEEFNFKEALPRDSYVLDFANVVDESSERGLTVEPLVYFRYVDFSSTEVRQQMRAFVDDLAESDYFEGQPDLFWLLYFELHLTTSPRTQNMTFNEQIQDFLSYKVYSDLFGSSLGIDDDGNVIGSRVRMRMVVDTEDATDQIAALAEQRRISMAQPINQDRPDDLAFFCYDGVFKLWEFLQIARQELILTTVVSIGAVSLVALVFIPHWSAICFVFPLICVLFIDLIGLIQWAGLHLNPVSYVSLAMSIGLLVDFVMHILFRYYEVSGTRHEKTEQLLRTMGSSILLGGMTTFLGIIPLMFSVSDVFVTVFYTFFGIVVLGMSHGLILLPTLLSMFGPEETVTLSGGAMVVISEENYPDRFEISGRGYAMETQC